MKTKVLGFLISSLIFGFYSARADLAPGDYQLIEVNLTENISHDPYLYDVKIIEKEKGQLFMVFTKSRYTSDYLISKEVGSEKRRFRRDIAGWRLGEAGGELKVSGAKRPKRSPGAS